MKILSHWMGTALSLLGMLFVWWGWGWLILSSTGGGFIPFAPPGRTGDGAFGVIVALALLYVGGFFYKAGAKIVRDE